MSGRVPRGREGSARPPPALRQLEASAAAPPPPLRGARAAGSERAQPRLLPRGRRGRARRRPKPGGPGSVRCSARRWGRGGRGAPWLRAVSAPRTPCSPSAIRAPGGPLNGSSRRRPRARLGARRGSASAASYGTENAFALLRRLPRGTLRR